MQHTSITMMDLFQSDSNVFDVQDSMDNLVSAYLESNTDLIKPSSMSLSTFSTLIIMSYLGYGLNFESLGYTELDKAVDLTTKGKSRALQDLLNGLEQLHNSLED